MLETNVKIGVQTDDTQLKRLLRNITSLDKKTLNNIQRQAQLTEKRFTDLGKRISGIGKTLSVSVTAPIVGFAALSVRAFGQQAAAIANVEAGLRSTGNAAGKTSEELQALASELQNNSLFGDEEILEGVTSTLLTFTNVAGEQFNRAQQAALDLSATLGTDLQSSAIQIGKALNDPVKGLTGLSRAGIQFTEDQKDVIKSLAETGRAAEAQNLVLQELERQFGGTSAAIAASGTGPLKQLSNTLGDLGEEFGKAITEVINPAVVRLNAFVQDLIARFQALSPEFRRNIVIFGGFAAAIGPILVALGSLTVLFAPLIGQITAFVSALQAAGASAITISRGFGTLLRIGTGAATAFIAIGKAAFELEQRFSFISETINTLIGVYFDLLNAGLKLIGINVDIEDGIETLKVAFNLFGETLEGVGRFITTVFGVAIAGLAGGLSKLGATTLRAVRLLSLIPGVKSIVGAEALGSLDSAIDKLDSLSKSSEEAAKGLINDFVAGGIATPGSPEEQPVVKPKVELENNAGDKILSDLKKSLKDKKTKVKVEPEITIPDAFDAAIGTAIADIEQQTLAAQRSLTGEELESSLERIENLGNASLTAIRDSFISTLDQISDPELLARAERSIADLNERIRPESSFETATNNLSDVRNATETATLNANDQFSGPELTQELERIEARSKKALEVVRQQFRDIIKTSDDPEIRLAAARVVGDINEEFEKVDTSLAQNEIKKLGEEVGGIVQGSFDTFFDSVVSGSQEANEAVENFVTDVIKQLASAALRQVLTAAFSGGGAVDSGQAPNPLGFNTGGRVVGPGSGTSDSIVARLSNGEFVQRAAAVRTFGNDFMSAVNDIDPSRAFQLLTDRFGSNNFAVGGLVGSINDFSGQLANISLPRFETGGLVDGQQPAQMGMNVSVNVVNNGSNQQSATTNQSINGQNVVIDVILDDIRSNGKIAKGMRNAFGLSRAVV